MTYCRNRMQQRGVAIGASLFILSLFTACANDQPKSLPPPTPDQVRGHTDRAFEKLKQEEQERGSQLPVPR